MGFLTALRFLTVIPLPFRRQPGPREMGAALVYFPLVGLLTGAILFLVNWGLNEIFSMAVSGALTLTLWVLISGAMHLDGVSDTCDGLAGNTHAKRLEIMADSHTGAYGVIGVALVLLLKYTGIVVLPELWLLKVWLLVPALGSWSMVLSIFTFPYARKTGGLGQGFKLGAGKLRLVMATVIMLAVAVVLARWDGLILMVVASLITLGIGWFFHVRLGGLTGDVYGTIKEITEVGALLSVPLVAGITW
ncbi:MAG: adenosylcobinamide-GDP ribazoletransferase [Dehalococcoidia bacterium]|nr:adenosylcobinamide-GDP ribazoletransferase [Dehalococcoidia bacterium]